MYPLTSEEERESASRFDRSLPWLASFATDALPFECYIHSVTASMEKRCLLPPKNVQEILMMEEQERFAHALRNEVVEELNTALVRGHRPERSSLRVG